MELELLLMAKSGDMDAQNKIISDNMNLIRHIMKQYKFSVYDEDMLSIGMFALYNAIIKYDIEQGVKFTSYAGVSISNAYKEHIRNENCKKRTSYSSIISLDMIVYENKTFLDTIVDDSAFGGSEILYNHIIKDIIPNLEDFDRSIFELRFINKLSQNDIIKELNLDWSQPRLSRYIKKVKENVLKQICF